MTPELASEQCVPCEGIKPMSYKEAKHAHKTLPEWTLKEGSMEKEFRFKSSLAGLNFAYAIGKIAEEQDDHPEMIMRWRRAKLAFSRASII